jgi:TP901 family phage tail tape measure protein
VPITAAELRAVVEADTSQAESGLSRFGGIIGGLGKAALFGTAGIATAFGGVAVAGVKMAADLQQSVANISTIKPEIDTSQVFNALNEMQTRVPQSSKLLADGLYNIFSSIEVTQGDALKLVEQFAKGATGAGTDVETFGTAVLGVMNAYGLSVGDASHISDVFFNTVNKGVVTGNELAQSLGPVTQSAKAAGVGLDELGALIAGVTKEGGPAAQNINNLNNLFMKIHTDKAAAGFKELGIATVDTSGKFRSVIDVMGDLRTHLQDMTEAQRANFLQDMFPDAQARQGAQTILSQLGFVTDALRTNTGEAGSAEAAYRKMSQTAAAQFQLLKNTGVRVLTQLGASILPAITPILVSFNKQLPDAIKAFQAATEGAGGGGGLTKLQTLAFALGKAFQFVRDAVLTFAQALSGNWTSAPGIVGFHALLGNLGLLIRNVIIPAIQQFVGWIGTVIAAFQSGGLSGGLQKIIGDLAGFAVQVGKTLLELGQKFVEWIAPFVPPMLAKLGELGKRLLGWIGDRIPEVLAQLQEWGQQFIDWIGPKIPPMLAELAEVGHALVQWLGEQVPVVLAKLLEWGEKFLEWVEPQIAPMIAKAGELAGKLFGWIQDQLPTIQAKLVEWGDEFVNWIEKNVIPKLPGKLKDIWSAINGFIAQVLVDVVPELIKLAAKFYEWVGTEAIPGLARELPGILAHIVGWILSIQGAILSEAASIGVAIIDGITNGVTSAAGRLVGSVRDAVGGALGAAKGFLGISSPSKVFADEVGSPIVQGIISGILAAHPELMTAMDAVTTQALDKARGIASAAGKDLRTYLGLGIASASATADQKAVDGMMGVFNSMFNTPIKVADQKAVDGMMGIFNSMFNKPAAQVTASAKTLGAQATTPVKTALGELPGTVKTALTDVARAMNASTSDTTKAAMNIGDGIMAGIALGVSQNVHRVIEALKGGVGLAIQQTKGALGIKSPSSVFASEVGRWIPAGIAAGILGSGNVIGAALASVTAPQSFGYSTASLVGAGSGLSTPPNRRGASSPVTVTLQAGAVQVYGAEGQSEEAIANRVIDKLSNVFTVAGREAGLSM